MLPPPLDCIILLYKNHEQNIMYDEEIMKTVCEYVQDMEVNDRLGYINSLTLELYASILRIGVSLPQWSEFVKDLKQSTNCYTTPHCP